MKLHFLFAPWWTATLTPILIAVAFVVVITFIFSLFQKHPYVSRILTPLLMVVGAALFVANITATHNYYSGNRSHIEGRYNITELQQNISERYKINLSKNQTIQLLNNFVYGNDLGISHEPVSVKIQGAMAQVKLKQQSNLWYLYTTQRELQPVKS